MTLGKYTVVAATRPDNPAFAVYRVFVGDRLIGAQFSVPCLSDCQWLERSSGTLAPYSSGRRVRTTRYSTGGHKTRNATQKREPEPA